MKRVYFQQRSIGTTPGSDTLIARHRELRRSNLTSELMIAMCEETITLLAKTFQKLSAQLGFEVGMRGGRAAEDMRRMTETAPVSPVSLAKAL